MISERLEYEKSYNIQNHISDQKKGPEYFMKKISHPKSASNMTNIDKNTASFDGVPDFLSEIP
jgi:hypothetical protein